MSLRGWVFISILYFVVPLHYADDMSLVAECPDELQMMLDVAARYAYTSHYSFNPNKSRIMVVGESGVSRSRNRLSRMWSIDSKSIVETDTWVHLGIKLSVSRSSLHHTLQCISSARSAFFSLQSVGSRFGCLHPSTSLRLFKTLVLPILIFGLEVDFRRIQRSLCWRDVRWPF